MFSSKRYYRRGPGEYKIRVGPVHVWRLTAAGTTLRFDAKVLSRGATLQRGTIAMVLRNLAAAQGDELRFSIRTPTAVAGVRGTCFFISIEDENNTYICACNGAIHVEGDGGQVVRNLASSHHQEVRVTRSHPAYP
jgi:hypothetical protein